jgi:hypothetical protein
MALESASPVSNDLAQRIEALHRTMAAAEGREGT